MAQTAANHTYPDFLGKSGEPVSEEEKRARETKEKRLRALAKDGMKLERVPEAERDHELCTAAIEQNGLALQYVPWSDRDMYFCQKALRSAGASLQYVPPALRSVSVCRLAMRNDGLALRYVPDETRNADVCRTAIEQNSQALQYVPASLLDADLCRHAMRVNGRALEFVPETLRTADICYEAVRTSGLALSYVPEHLRTPLLVVRALFSALADVRQRTTITYQAPPDWDELKKTKPREEWSRFENWLVTRPEDFPFPAELALPPAEVTDYLRNLGREYAEAAGQPDFLAKCSGQGHGFWLEVPKDVEGQLPWRVYSAGLALLMSGAADEHGLPEKAGACNAAAALMDWKAGWTDLPPQPDKDK